MRTGTSRVWPSADVTSACTSAGGGSFSFRTTPTTPKMISTTASAPAMSGAVDGRSDGGRRRRGRRRRRLAPLGEDVDRAHARPPLGEQIEIEQRDHLGARCPAPG